MLVCVFKHLFIWDFFLSPHCSLSFPPKRYAAMENSYAPSNVTLLILATRTGKGCRQNLVLISFFLFCCDNADSEITSYVSCCIPHTDISYSIASISQFNHRWVLIWLQMVTLAPSPYFTTLISMLLSFIKWAPVVLHSSSFFLICCTTVLTTKLISHFLKCTVMSRVGGGGGGVMLVTRRKVPTL